MTTPDQSRDPSSPSSVKIIYSERGDRNPEFTRFFDLASQGTKDPAELQAEIDAAWAEHRGQCANQDGWAR